MSDLEKKERMDIREFLGHLDNDPERMEQLKEALKFIVDATDDEKWELFSTKLTYLENLRDKFDMPDNRFDPHWLYAKEAMSVLERFFLRMTGYFPTWIPEIYLDLCMTKTGRPAKYDISTRACNCFFIREMIYRGASETQAMKLVMRLRGDSAMTSGHLRELQDSYREFKIADPYSPEDISVDGDFHFPRNANRLIGFLGFDISNLEGEDKASVKAVNAFRSSCEALISLMKKYREKVALSSVEPPEAFGGVLGWVESNFEDPLDYFFRHESHATVPIEQRQEGLGKYLFAIFDHLYEMKKTGVE